MQSSLALLSVQMQFFKNLPAEKGPEATAPEGPAEKR